MVSLNTLRTKYGVVLALVIALATFAFIYSLKNDAGPVQGDGQNPVVGEVGGEEVDRMEFGAAYNDASILMGNNDASYDQSAQIIALAWESLKEDKLTVPALDELGLSVSAKESKAMLRGEVVSSIFASLFADPATGEYNPALLSNFLEMAKSDATANRAWELIKKKADIERATGKYTDLVRNGAYANALMVNKGLVAENNTYKGHYVMCNYNMVADSLVTVTEKEIEKYYETNKDKYEQTPYRTVSYAHFEIEPSEADKAAVEAQAKANAKILAASRDLNAFVRANSNAEESNYVLASSLSSDELAALRAGKMYGPKLEGDEWYASRAIATRNAPETFELQHIVLDASDKAKVETVYNAAKAAGADFEALLAEHSLQNTPNNNKEEVEYSSLPVKFADALATAKKGSVVKVENGDMVLVTKVLSVGQRARHYRLVTLTYPVLASADTQNAIYKQVDEFAGKAKGSVENFENAATTVSPSSMNLYKGNRFVPGLPNSLEVARWAATAKVGEVSSVFNLHEGGWAVAVVTAVNESEYRPLSQVSAQIKNILVKEKKAALLKEKMQGATLEEIAANAGSKVESFADVKTSATYIAGIGVEPCVAGALSTVNAEAAGKLLPLVAGGRGVFAIVVDNVAVAEDQTLDAERVKMQANEERMAVSRAFGATEEAAKVEDNTLLYF